MRRLRWIGALVAIVTLAALLWGSMYGAGAATERYVKEVEGVIHAAEEQAEEAWTTSGKLSIMGDAFVEASHLAPPSGADLGTVVRIKQVLKEGREYFASADGEGTMIKDFVLGFIAGTIDFSGGMGLATGTLLTAKSLEISSDEAERREFIEALQELDRYRSDN